MISASISTLSRASVGTAWKAPGMGGYLAVAYRWTDEDLGDNASITVGGLTGITAGDTLIALMPRDEDGTGSTTAANSKPWLYIVRSGTLFGGLQATTAMATFKGNPKGGIPSSGMGSRTAGPALSAELLGFMLGPDSWTASTIDSLETARTGTGVW